MIVVFVVESEDQLDCGVAWCQKFVRMGARSIKLVVVGEDRKTLAEHSRRRVGDLIDKVSIEVQRSRREIAAVLHHASPVRSSMLLLIFREHDPGFQQELFEQSPARAIWVRGSPRPKNTPGRILSVLADHERTMATCEQMIGVTPAGGLLDSVPGENQEIKSLVDQAMKSHQVQDGDLIVCGADQFGSEDVGYQCGLSALRTARAGSVALIQSGHSWAESLISRVYRLAANVTPPMDRSARRELAQDLESGSQPNLEYLGLMSASAMLAAFGLLQDSAAVIIGAMLIAPLMTPIVGAGLALTQGNRPCFRPREERSCLGSSALWRPARHLDGWSCCFKNLP